MKLILCALLTVVPTFTRTIDEPIPEDAAHCCKIVVFDEVDYAEIVWDRAFEESAEDWQARMDADIAKYAKKGGYSESRVSTTGYSM